MKRKLDQGLAIDLNDQVVAWQTPATDAFRSRSGDRKDEMGLDQQARSGTWRSPTAGMEQIDRRSDAALDRECSRKNAQISLAAEARHWQSPQARDHRSGIIQPETAAKHLGSRPINEQVLNWPSPRSEDSECCGNHPKATDSLTGATQNWPTPNSALLNDGESPESFLQRQAQLKAKGINGNGAGMPLAIAASLSSRPAPTTAYRGLRSYPSHRTLRRLSRVSNLSPDLRLMLDSWMYAWWSDRQRRLAKPWQRPCERKRLNVRFVELLLSWPVCWTSARTALEPQAMALWRSRALQQLESYWSARRTADGCDEDGQMMLFAQPAGCLETTSRRPATAVRAQGTRAAV